MNKRLLESDVLLEEQNSLNQLEIQPSLLVILNKDEYGRRYDELLQSNGEDANYQLLRLLGSPSMEL